MKQNIFLTALLAAACSAPITAQACSAVLLKGTGYGVVGFNENWKSMPGMVVINKRGIVKNGLSWERLVSEEIADKAGITWTSRYGSVSFNLLGIDLPCYGVNEKGVFIVELFLDKTYSEPDERRANLFWGHWIQYQLDNCATTEEVLSGLNRAPVIDWWPEFPGSHFFVCDKGGNTAVIELINGKYVIASGAGMPVPVLCNNLYGKELEKLKTYRGFGGNRVFDMDSQEWDDRYIKAACYLKDYDPESDGQPVDYMWRILDRIHRGEWQLVYDIRKAQLQFRSDLGADIKTIAMDSIDFSGRIPRYLDLNSSLSGNVSEQFADLTASVNREYAAKGFPIGYENPEFIRGKGFAALQENLDNYVRETYGD